MTRYLRDPDSCVDAILARLGKRIVVGTPLGIGKPNALLNALYRRACADASVQLDIITALSLNPPKGNSELESRFLRPVAERVWPAYPRLAFVDDAAAERLPANVRLIEFYLQSGSALRNATRQRSYISSNYTDVAEDMVARGVNLLLQAVACRETDGQRQLSLSSNPDVTLQLLPLMRRLSRVWMAVAQINRELPWMGHAAALDESCFDLVLDDARLSHAPFAVPHELVATADWAIGLRASAWVVDGGCLQVGIGALGDAACHALRLRANRADAYVRALTALGVTPPTPFQQGLHGVSEMISNPLFSLYEAGLMRRHAYRHLAIQRLADAGVLRDGASLPDDLYDRLWRDGGLPDTLREADLGALHHHGLAAEGLVLDAGRLRLPGGERCANDLSDANVRGALDRRARGSGLRGGVALRGAFFIGPADFYARLRALSPDALDRIEMTRVDHVNALGADRALEHLQRRDARFVNITMKATLLGAAVSDQLSEGQVVSGVGGQYNFVSMARQLPDARSILLLRAVHGHGRQCQSNIVWEYPHATIPRHLRDVYITEYGAADLRGKTDEECIRAMIEIADSRFQVALLQAAQAAGKLDPHYRVPDHAQHNLPSRINQQLASSLADGSLPALPFGCDLTAAELKLAGVLSRLKQAAESRRWALAMAWLRPAPANDADVAAALTHLALQRPANAGERRLARLVRAAFRL